MNRTHKKKKSSVISFIATYIILACFIGIAVFWTGKYEGVVSNETGITDLSTLPKYKDFQTPYVTVNANKPYFDDGDYALQPFEKYSDLDNLGRCGVAFVNACIDIMPTEERGNIGMVKPSGWNQAKYDGIINSNPPYLFNRCHLIGYQISAENANEKNLRISFRGIA